MCIINLSTAINHKNASILWNFYSFPANVFVLCLSGYASKYFMRFNSFLLKQQKKTMRILNELLLWRVVFRPVPDGIVGINQGVKFLISVMVGKSVLTFPLHNIQWFGFSVMPPVLALLSACMTVCLIKNRLIFGASIYYFVFGASATPGLRDCLSVCFSGVITIHFSRL